jgi:hypothetical protein
VFLTEREFYHHEVRAAMSYRPSPLRTQQRQANAGIWSLQSGKPGTGEPAGASNLELGTDPGSPGRSDDSAGRRNGAGSTGLAYLILGMTSFTIESMAQILSKKRTACHGSAPFFAVACIVTCLM